MKYATATMLLLTVLFAAGCQDAAPEATAPPPPQVDVAQPINREIVLWHKYTGRMAAVESVDVRARVSGYLSSIHFVEGQRVEEGDLLFVIDPRPFEAALASEEAQLRRAKAELEAAQARTAQSVAEKEQAVARQTLAQQRRDRVKRLLEREAITQDEFEEAVSQYTQAVADVEAANAAIAAAEAAVETARASIAVNETEVENAKLQLSYTEIRAPITGRISNRRITEGNLVDGGNENADALTTIVRLDPIHCYFDAHEREVLAYMRLIQAGQQESSREGEYRNPVFMKLVDETGYPHAGHIDFVDNRIDPNTGTLRVRAIFPNPNNFLTPGMFAEVRLPGSIPHEAVLIPDIAVGTDQSETYVYVVNGAKKIERRDIELGPLRHGLRIVEAGLDGSENLVMSGLQTIRPGVEVNPVDTKVELEMEEDLPDTFRPVPRAEWLTLMPKPTPDKLADRAAQSE